MPVNRKNVVQCLQGFEFQNLFIEELGWDRPKLGDFTFEIKDENYRISNISEKRGVQVFVCIPAEKVKYPDNTVRRRIESKVRKIAHEHLIIFIDHGQSIQRWQWVFRKAGQPAQYREHKFDKGQGSEALLQKLDEIEINIEDEEGLRLLDVAQKLKDAFDKDKVTKKFYDHFKTQQKIFRGFIENIPGEHDQNWYSAVMLNRMMFIYFIQKKNFLNGDVNYLKTKLGEMKEKFGEDNYYTFYTHFLRRLFHEGLDGHTPRGQELDNLLGTIPYLNGGIFGHHELEEKYPDIDIKDEAFEKLFAFFDQYQWHLDDRPLMDDKEINPDVLGYIFEKFINQKEMGAYYTKEDITEYISKNTVIPFLFDQAKEQCLIAFEGDRTVWDLLKENPDRYFYDAVKKGIVLDGVDKTEDIKNTTVGQIPENVAIGLDTTVPNLLDSRKDWNTKTPEELALPTEIWRETIARWQRYFEVRQKIENGKIQSINDFITYNLNIRQFAQDVVETWEGPELIRAFYKAITKITVLDPTVGSGAFLFAALNILEPLYEACLNRMAEFVEDLPPDAPKSKFSDFKVIISKIDKHPSRSYFIYKTIIINNLYGVDIMDEAVEICKLRLFLKLVAQIDTVKQIEPLPDIDFNIRAGNTLVGFATEKEVDDAIDKELGGQGKLIFGDPKKEIKDKAELVGSAFQMFRLQQTKLGGKITPEYKSKLKDSLMELEETLNHYLAGEYGVKHIDKDKYQQWLISHKPFHWLVEFYGILNDGGFDVIIGNPPYVVYNKVSNQYTVKDFFTYSCNDLYAFVIERSLKICNEKGKLSLIIPISYLSTDGFSPLRELIEKRCSISWNSSYSMRPAKLFEGAEKHLCIIVTEKNVRNTHIWFTSKYYRWLSSERETLFPQINYIEINDKYFIHKSISKVGSVYEKHILKSLINDGKKVDNFTIINGAYKLVHTRKLRYFVQFLDVPPKIIDEKGNIRITSELKTVSFDNMDFRDVCLSAFSSNLFFWYYLAFSDCRNVNRREVFGFPINLTRFSNQLINNISKLSIKLMNDLQYNSNINIMNYKKYGRLEIQVFSPRKSKPIIDEIDKVLAEHYGFTEEELDFIINYDIKYRMGKELNN